MSEDKNVEWTSREAALLAALPREDRVPGREADDIIAALTVSEGLRRTSRWVLPLQLAAAVALFGIGGFAGSHVTQRKSLEGALDRTDLSLDDRVLLLQRAGSAYVRAAQDYAQATSRTDSTAVQVASQVLLGAASAIARQSLDGGLSDRLTSVLSSAATRNAGRVQPIVQWY